MTYSTEQVGDVWIMNLKGDVWGGWDIVELKDTVSRLAEDGARKFLVDLRRTHYVSSNGIGVLVAVLATLRKNDARLKLCSVSVRSRRALVVTGVWQLFETHKDRVSALRAFASGTGGGSKAGSPLQTSSRMG
jgi:anti-anti-sigma factor